MHTTALTVFSAATVKSVSKAGIVDDAAFTNVGSLAHAESPKTAAMKRAAKTFTFIHAYILCYFTILIIKKKRSLLLLHRLTLNC